MAVLTTTSRSTFVMSSCLKRLCHAMQESTINGVTTDYMCFEAHGRKYSVDIVKGAHRTRIKGSGWKKFTSEFSLQKGAVVIFDLDRRPRQAHVVVQSDDLDIVEGSSSDGDADEEMIDGDITDVDEDGGSIKIEYTRGLTLNDAQQDILNELVLNFKSKFLGVSFLHCLTTTDTQVGQMLFFVVDTESTSEGCYKLKHP
ncbi:uncharacterized protein [Triticum aestivum]|uniref:uncharacterized protein n=1 Tax=Triticum aestivum TaxID=4565 RepID=UPI001D0311CD|nr:uncharacterized protein LOC123059589 [Triticum aestivum]XP_044338058.1 uncharacterized protein LOC123059589 [Triticum aestivum]